MGLPGKRRTASSGRRRAANFALKQPAIMVCPKCGKDKRPHYACRYCGFYRGKEIVNTLAKTKKLTSSAAKKTA